MSIEERLTRALAAEAETIDVDVEELRARTRQRLTAAGVPAGAPARPARGPLLLGMAASVALAASAVVFLSTEGRMNPATDSDPGGVESAFSCPVQRDIDVTSGAQDEFLPQLGPGGPAAVAREHGAPRWDFVEDGNRATLRLGNDDGSLGSITTYRAVDDGWVPVSAVACGGAGNSPAVPTRDELRLGVHGYPPHESTISAERADGASVFVDDRAAYDHAGLVTSHRSTWVAPCGARLCWQAGEATGYVAASLRANVPTIAQDVSSLLFDPDVMVGRHNPFGMWAVWDPDGTVRALRAVLEGGRVRESQVFTDPSWGGGVLHVVVAPRAATRWVETETTSREVARWAPEEVTGYEPDTGE